jgi:seryl-tRNA synthetase
MKYGTVLARRAPLEAPHAAQAMEEAVERGWISAFAEGQYVYHGRWATLVRLLQQELVARAQRLGFEEWILPRYIPAAALDSFKLTQFAPDLLIPAGPDSFLDPVQCVSFYHYLRGRTLRREDLPLRVVEVMGGWTWRAETPDTLDGPYRAREFLRVEHVFCGTREQVREQRRRVRDSLTELLTRLGVGWQVVVGHGCMDLPSLTDARENARGADDIPIQDIEVPIRGMLHRLPELPAPGTTSHDVLQGSGLVEEVSDSGYWDHDEICGCSVEGDHLTTDFNVVDEEGTPLWSGCCGMGLNRLVLALLYQHGFDAVEGVVREAIAPR